ncbi:MAG: amino acid ABC transporter substrate-binding protein [Rhodospirillales bacterium]|nr:MAG: amino acid ABC transporter substrate-binding protein [Rhodospirillales bacterium]
MTWRLLFIWVVLVLTTNVQAAEPIEIGVSLGLTGTYSRPAKMQERGYRLWETHINRRGGLLGRPVRVVIRDDKSDSAEAIKIYRDLIAKRRVHLVFGPYSSEISEAVAPVLEDSGYPTVLPGAAADRIWQNGYTNVFGLFTPASKYALEMLRLAVLYDLRRIAIVYADDAFSVEVAKGAKKWAHLANREVVLFEGFEKGTHDLHYLAIKTRQARADLLVTAGHFDESVDMRRALKAEGWYPRAYFATIGPTLQRYGEVVKQDAELTFAPSLWEPDESLEFTGSRKFIRAFLRDYGILPSYHAANAYAAGQVIEEVVTNANSLDRKKIRQALYKLDTTVAIGRYQVDRFGVPVKHRPLIIQWLDGKKEIVWPEEHRTAQPVFR